MIHSQEEYEKAVEASNILFGGATSKRFANSTNRPCCRFSKESRNTKSPVRN